MSPPLQIPPLVFQYWQSSIDRMWYWHLKASTNEKLAQGEAYATKAGCLKAIELVKQAARAPLENLSAPEDLGKKRPAFNGGPESSL